jgi:hypothetical protein
MTIKLVLLIIQHLASFYGHRGGKGNVGNNLTAERRANMSMALSGKDIKVYGHRGGMSARAACGMGINWENKYAEFKISWKCRRKEPSYIIGKRISWAKEVILNATIRKELAENKGSTVWSERRVKLSDCVARKRRK